MRGFHRKWAALAALAAAAALLAGAAGAQSAAPKASSAKPQKKPAASVTIVVTNSRPVTLTELDATPSGLYFPKAIVSHLAPGAKTSAVIATDKDCVYDLRGVYSDNSVTELSSIDLCKDHNVNLIE